MKKLLLSLLVLAGLSYYALSVYRTPEMPQAQVQGPIPDKDKAASQKIDKALERFQKSEGK